MTSVPSIKAIETIYPWPDGTRFRSRLEARWAIVLDRLDISWQYEAQGYEFDGTRYLPDFYLPDWDMYIEVKGTYPQFADVLKATLFAYHRQRPVLVCHSPLKELWPMYLLHGDKDPVGTRQIESVPAWFIDCPLCRDLAMLTVYPKGPGMDLIAETDFLGHGIFYSSHPPTERCIGANIKIKRPRWPVVMTERIAKAYAAGVQAQFEYGKTPKAIKRKR